MRFFAGLNEAEANQVFAALRPRPFRKGAAAVLARDFAERVGFVWSGRFQLVVAMPPKRAFSLTRLKQGDSFGHVTALSGQFGEGVRLVCSETGVVLDTEADAFARLRRSIPALAEATLSLLSKIAADQSGRIFELAALTARERIQAEVLRLCRDGEWRGRRSTVRPAPTHQEIADNVGAAREVVTRCLKALAGEGLIRLERGALDVLDVDRLMKLDRAATGRVMFDVERYAGRS